MAAVTICSDFGAPQNKVSVSIVSPSICHEVMGPYAMILVFWMLSFKPNFSLSSFTFKLVVNKHNSIITMLLRILWPLIHLKFFSLNCFPLHYKQESIWFIQAVNSYSIQENQLYGSAQIATGYSDYISPMGLVITAIAIIFRKKESDYQLMDWHAPSTKADHSPLLEPCTTSLTMAKRPFEIVRNKN